ncbi:PREDICTED: 5-hydroxytryptamine receptor 2C isoform X1 [Colobus angolensis palliatus]|uniref:5-hydroxytryptamine receptor 2C n=1 Tax=Colobus angolensis palliatus TaxID=336983 RepID=A0A2K5JFB6_COLAP|nr:PREDICTED: 5-hydroxytryptamine receptor 2C isoform X1 [Colobus angolensis palliatus]
MVNLRNAVHSFLVHLIGLLVWQCDISVSPVAAIVTDIFNTSDGGRFKFPDGVQNWPALSIVVIIIMTIGGNILVIMAVSMEKKLHNATNYFLMSLAIADMLVGLLVMPLSLLAILYDYVWPLPRYLCPVWISLDVLFSTASIMHLCAISLDRYVAIRNPIEHSRFNSRTKAIMKIAIVWAISIGVSVPIPVIGLRDEDKVFVNNTTCVLNDPNFVLIGSFVAFFIPLTIMVITYCLTIYVLRRQALMLLHGHTEEPPGLSLDFLKCCKRNTAKEENAANPNQDQNARRRRKKERRPRGTMQAINNERKASKVLGIVFFVFLIMWCPFFITNILSVLCEKSCNQKLMEKLLNVFVWIGYVCSGINPLVYTLFNKIYRRAFSNYLRCNYKVEKKPPVRQIPRVAATALSGRELNVNIYRHTNEPVIKKASDNEPGIEMQVENLELPVNPSSVVSERISSV